MATLDELLAETCSINCPCCSGGKGRDCPECGDDGSVTVSRFETLPAEQQVPVLWAEVQRLKGLLADRYDRPARVPVADTRGNEGLRQVRECHACGCRENRWDNALGGWSCSCCSAYELQDETNWGQGCGKRAVRR